MADKEQLALLAQGSRAWNEWRQRNPDAKVDLSSAELVGAKLASADLSDADLTDANLANTELFNANLRSANLAGANLSNAELTDANLTGGNLTGLNLTGARLVYTILGNVDLSKALGLETVVHDGPSVIDHLTLLQSRTTSPVIPPGLRPARPAD